MYIPEHQIEDIRLRSDIVEIIGEHVRLSPRGKNYIGLCPFHSEKTPSFNVNPGLGIYKCFGCGKSGNVFRFLMDLEHESFPEVVRQLAARAGIVIEQEEQTDDERQKQSRHDAAHRALAAACEYYHGLLFSPTGERALRYVHQRGFDDAVVTSFELGYSADEWHALHSELLRKGYSEQCLEDAGLIISRDDGTRYDRFRGRLMFPIHDALGRIVGFGARTMEKSHDGAKYINSPQSLVYDKSRVLYGLFQAKSAIRQLDMAILTEGYADTISLHQFGFTNAIASSGTALTSEQLSLLSRYTKNLCLIYDGDEAGISAMMRGGEIALSAGFDLRIVSLPPGEDPDTFVHSHGASAFASAVREAGSFIDFVAQRFVSQGMFGSSKSSAEAIRELTRLVALIDDTLQREFLIRHLAQHFSLREELLYAEVQKWHPNQQGLSSRRSTSSDRYAASARSSVSAPISEPDAAENRQKSVPVHMLAEEKALLRWAIKDQSALGVMVQEFGVNEQTFPTPMAQHVFKAVEHAVHNGVEIASLLGNEEHLSAEEQDVVTELLFSDEQPSQNWSKFDVTINEIDITLLIPNLLLGLELEAVQREIKDLLTQIREHHDDESLLVRFHQLSKQRTELEQKLRDIRTDEEEE